jgi:hypothetical protein
MFLLYINDLESCTEHGWPTFFADDTSILIAGNSSNNVQSKMNETINKLTKWFERNRLIINKDKTIAKSFHQPHIVHFESPSIKFHNIQSSNIRNIQNFWESGWTRV